jgi:hypothetical protein
MRGKTSDLDLRLTEPIEGRLVILNNFQGFLGQECVLEIKFISRRDWIEEILAQIRFERWNDLVGFILANIDALKPRMRQNFGYTICAQSFSAVFVK